MKNSYYTEEQKKRLKRYLAFGYPRADLSYTGAELGRAELGKMILGKR